jgi:RNA polymerase sigma factor (sigma-70 family)
LQNDVDKLTDHLFRHEAGRIIAVLTRLFGFQNADLVEDVVQEAFAKALHDWRFRVPDNPSAWLIQVARNKAIDAVRRQRHQREFSAETSALLESGYTASPTIDNLFLDHEIQDSQLQMIFACCHPSLDPEDQIALTLKTCSGFSVAEIASALLTSTEATKKRLQRARTFLAGHKIKLTIPTGSELNNRLDRVLHALYLLFNEGYNSSSKDELIRKDLCQEAIRLALLLTNHPLVQSPKCHSLVALLALLSSRFEARLDENSEIVLLEDQDRSKWNRELINIGLSYFEKSMDGDDVSEYHLQAAIVAEHSIAPAFEQTNWSRILTLYDMLLRRDDSPVVTLNRAVVVGRISGPEKGIEEIMNIPGIESLLNTHYLFAAILGDFYCKTGDHQRALALLERAERMTNSEVEKRLLRRKMRT